MYNLFLYIKQRFNQTSFPRDTSAANYVTLSIDIFWEESKEGKRDNIDLYF